MIKTSKFALKLTAGLLLGLFVLNCQAKSTPSFTTTAKKQSSLTPASALKKLKDGNLRFLQQTMRQHNHLGMARYTTNKGQHPFAFVLSCMDSRSEPALAFNQGIGDVFVGQVAGNVINNDMLASMEYAVHSGVKILVIMGHTHCGAVEAACEGKAFGHVDALIAQIKPAVDTAKKAHPTLSCDSPKLIDAIVKNNVKDMIAAVKTRSPYLHKAIAKHEVGIVGAVHNIKTGKIQFFDADVSSK